MTRAPFLTLQRALEAKAAANETAPTRDRFPNCIRVDGSHIQPIFEAAVTAVQAQFKHLSKDDIFAPPPGWFDAALGRQIAIHITLRRFDVSRNQLCNELERSRESIQRALRTIDERLEAREFMETYTAIVSHAERLRDGTNEDRS